MQYNKIVTNATETIEFPIHVVVMDMVYLLEEELRKRDYLPILFDFDKPTSQDLTETVTTLAKMSAVLRISTFCSEDRTSSPYRLTGIAVAAASRCSFSS